MDISIMNMAIDILIRYISQKGISKSKLAYMIDDTPQNLGKRLKRGYIDCNDLYKISSALEHNFFKDLSEEYEREKRKSMPVVDMIMREPEAVYGGLEAVVRKIVREELKGKK